MLAIAFDLTVSELERLHPRSVAAASIRDPRAFRVEQWSDLTSILKS